jgi:hypothetical protein
MTTPRRSSVFPKPVLGISGIQSRIPLGIRNGKDQSRIPITPTPAEADGFTLTLRPLPGWPLPPWQRLRAGLKRLLRNHGLRCITCRPSAPPDEIPPL